MTKPDSAAREQAEMSLRRISGQVTVLENFERRLNRQIHEAQEAGRDDYVRELLQRRISVRSQLQDVQRRQQHAREAVGRLG
ncbi:hypothetical protein [Actinomycetospora sp. TBRC 11914]|uniref:hypothetical protein n=1 Tax=Actinomycetospora sp. TBRC 11914 TaxID=2729387 RepID=UPI00145E61D1|nr:hypothetical protein [Actinomycetospora sp. TBRC 11914]NMO91756.1 hypothetical protein [Actinomycetospora sp. TBRC 11914]